MRRARAVALATLLLGCGGGAATAADETTPPPATEEDAAGAEAALDRELRAAYADFRARLAAAVESENLPGLFEVLGQPMPEDADAQRDQTLAIGRMMVAMMEPIDDADTVRLLHEGDRAALVVAEDECEGEACTLELTILRFTREGDAWRASGPHFSQSLTEDDTDQPRQDRIDAALEDPRFGLEPPPREE